MDEIASYEPYVDVPGRRMSLRLWEAEVLLRAAAYVVLIEAAVVVGVAALVLILAPKQLGLMEPGAACSLFSSPVLVVVGVGLLRRNQTARKAMGAFLFAWMIAMVFQVGPLLYGAARAGLDLADFVFVPLLVLPQAYLVFALFLPTTHLAFQDELHGTPLARLSSACLATWSARGLAARVVVWLTFASVLLAVVGSLGMGRLD